MSVKNHYDILGISNDSSKKEIEEAYKKLARKFHPDTNSHDNFFLEMFKNINEAKQVLANDETRMEYDLELLTYSEAYQVLEQRSEEDRFIKNQRRKKYTKTRSKRKLKRIIAFSSVALVMIAFLVIGVNRLDQSQKQAENSADQLQIKIIEDSIIMPVTNLAVLEEKEKENFHVNNKSQQQLLINQGDKEIGHTEIKKKLKIKRGEKNLSFKQMDDILNSIMNEKAKRNAKTNCIQIFKTSISNVAGFNIADFLQGKGFIIAGRRILPGQQKGIKVDASGSCISLIIGSL